MTDCRKVKEIMNDDKVQVITAGNLQKEKYMSQKNYQKLVSQH